MRGQFEKALVRQKITTLRNIFFVKSQDVTDYRFSFLYQRCSIRIRFFDQNLTAVNSSTTYYVQQSTNRYKHFLISTSTKAGIAQEGIFFHTQFISLMYFINKIVGNQRKTKPTFITSVLKSWIPGGLSFVKFRLFLLIKFLRQIN